VQCSRPTCELSAGKGLPLTAADAEWHSCTCCDTIVYSTWLPYVRASVPQRASRVARRKGLLDGGASVAPLARYHLAGGMEGTGGWSRRAGHDTVKRAEVLG
jgi:hypothetical protein